jgi:hypothetical protein
MLLLKDSWETIRALSSLRRLGVINVTPFSFSGMSDLIYVGFFSFFSSEGGRDDREEDVGSKWLPLPLRLYFWLPLVIILALGAVGLEIALHYSHVKQGVFHKFWLVLFFFFMR